MFVRRVFPAFAVFVLLALGTAVSPPPASAQNLAQLYRMSPSSGQTAAFQAALRAHSEWREANGDPWSWDLWQVVQGESTGDVIAYSGEHAWEDWDAYYGSDFGARADAHFSSTVGKAIESAHGWIESTDTAHARVPEDLDAIQVVSVITYHLKPGKVQAFREAMGKIHDAIVEADHPIHYVFHWPEAGLPGPSVNLVVLYESWADMEEPETSMMELLQDAYGEDETTALTEAFDDTYTGVENEVLMRRPDLSVTGSVGM